MTGKTFDQVFKADFTSLEPIFLQHLREYQQKYNTSLDINSITIFKPKIDDEIQKVLTLLLLRNPNSKQLKKPACVFSQKSRQKKKRKLQKKKQLLKLNFFKMKGCLKVLKRIKKSNL